MLRIHIARHLKSSLYDLGIMDSELLLKFIGYFPDYLSALSRTLSRLFWTTFVETAVYLCAVSDLTIHLYKWLPRWNVKKM